MSVILRNTGPTTLTKAWYEDGVQVDAGTVTVGIVDADDTTVVASGTATSKSGSGSSTTYSYTLPIQTAVKELTITWTRADTDAALTDTVEVVGGHLFNLNDARTFTVSGAQTPLSSSVTYPDGTIAEARDRITGMFAQHCGVSFIPRYARLELPGTGTRSLTVQHRRISTVLAATINGTAQTASNIEPVWNDRVLWHKTGVWSAATSSNPRNVTVSYEHGYQQVPSDIRRAALLLLLREVVPSDIPDRALSLTNEFGNMRLAVPGVDYPTGIPQVDEILNRYRYPDVI
jgi:hypothetical protein